MLRFKCRVSARGLAIGARTGLMASCTVSQERHCGSDCHLRHLVRSGSSDRRIPRVSLQCLTRSTRQIGSLDLSRGVDTRSKGLFAVPGRLLLRTVNGLFKPRIELRRLDFQSFGESLEHESFLFS